MPVTDLLADNHLFSRALAALFGADGPNGVTDRDEVVIRVSDALVPVMRDRFRRNRIAMTGAEIDDVAAIMAARAMISTYEATLERLAVARQTGSNTVTRPAIP
jgi:hypothetical protein